jgi:hypothetical protein
MKKMEVGKGNECGSATAIRSATRLAVGMLGKFVRRHGSHGHVAVFSTRTLRSPSNRLAGCANQPCPLNYQAEHYGMRALLPRPVAVGEARGVDSLNKNYPILW